MRQRLPWVGLVLVTLCLQACAEAVVVGGMGTVIAFHDARSAKVMIKDQGIETAAQRAIDNDPGLKEQGRVNVVSFNRTVLITGEVPTRELKQQAYRLVSGIEGVSRVQDELRVVPVELGGTWMRNSVTTARVKTRLFFRDFDGTRVKVVSERGNVYLMGLVSHAESDDVISMVQDVGGVRKVVKVFEYVD